jgi:hypothetical protein
LGVKQAMEQELLTVPEHPSSSPVFSGVRVTRSLVLYVCFVDHCLFFCTFSIGHCVVCSSSIYGFWLPLWYLQTLHGYCDMLLCHDCILLHTTTSLAIFRLDNIKLKSPDYSTFTRAQFHGRDNQTGSAHSCPRSGRPCITTSSQVRYIRVS